MLSEAELEKRFGMAKDYYRAILSLSEEEFRILIARTLKELNMDITSERDHHHHPSWSKHMTSAACKDKTPRHEEPLPSQGWG